MFHPSMIAAVSCVAVRVLLNKKVVPVICCGITISKKPWMPHPTSQYHSRPTKLHGKRCPSKSLFGVGRDSILHKTQRLGQQSASKVPRCFRVSIRNVRMPLLVHHFQRPILWTWCENYSMNSEVENKAFGVLSECRSP